MKLKLTLFTALAFVAASGVAAAADTPTRPSRGLPEKLRPYDANNDGRLSREEYKAFVDDQRPENPKSEWDTDGDGKLSEAEIEAARAAMRAKLEARFLARFNEADTGGGGEDGTEPDGLLTLEEFTNTLPDDVSADRAKAAFDRLDTDDDDKISKDEFFKFNGLPPRPDAPRPPKPQHNSPKPKPPVPPALPEALKAFDTDGNGILSRAEIAAAIKAGTWPGRPKPPVDGGGGDQPPVGGQ